MKPDANMAHDSRIVTRGSRRTDAQWEAPDSAVVDAPVPQRLMGLDARIVGWKKQRAGLIAYLLVKVEAGDWHAVQDAASDIREINAKLEVLG
jgi:hypothetical protein